MKERKKGSENVKISYADIEHIHELLTVVIVLLAGLMIAILWWSTYADVNRNGLEQVLIKQYNFTEADCVEWQFNDNVCEQMCSGYGEVCRKNCLAVRQSVLGACKLYCRTIQVSDGEVCKTTGYLYNYISHETQNITECTPLYSNITAFCIDAATVQKVRRNEPLPHPEGRGILRG